MLGNNLTFQLSSFDGNMYETIFLINYMMEKSGTTRLKVVDYDSMSGKHVWVNSEIIFTSVISQVVSMVAPKDQWFVNMWISKGGK